VQEKNTQTTTTIFLQLALGSNTKNQRQPHVLEALNFMTRTSRGFLSSTKLKQAQNQGNRRSAARREKHRKAPRS